MSTHKLHASILRFLIMFLANCKCIKRWFLPEVIFLENLNQFYVNFKTNWKIGNCLLKSFTLDAFNSTSFKKFIKNSFMELHTMMYSLQCNRKLNCNILRIDLYHKFHTVIGNNSKDCVWDWVNGTIKFI